MEVKEAVKWIFDIWHEWENVYGADAQANLESGNKMDEVIDLLKSLEAENKALKKENKAYKGIIREIENDFGNGILQNENGFGVKLEHLIEIKKQKYLGGGE